MKAYIISFLLLLLLTSFCLYESEAYNPEIAEIESYNLDHVDTLVDIGSQNGKYAKEIAKFYPKLFLVLEDLNEYKLCRQGGVDCKNKNTLREIKKVFRNSRKYPGIENRYQFIEGGKDTIPLASGSCNRILCRKALHEFEDCESMVNELYRVLKQNGVLTISEVEPAYKNEVDEFCNNRYLSQKDVLMIMKKFKLINIKPIDYKAGLIVTYNFTKP